MAEKSHAFESRGADSLMLPQCVSDLCCLQIGSLPDATRELCTPFGAEAAAFSWNSRGSDIGL